MTNWKVTDFSVRTTTSSKTSDSLYANGKMQVAVYVLIIAVNLSDNSRYNLTPSELNNIQLVDYNTSSVLRGSWFYTDQENEFDHSLGLEESALEAPPTSTLDNSPQAKRYWVSTTKAGSQNVGATITQPNGTVIITNDPDFDSHVTLLGKQSFSYTTGNTILTPKDTDNGTYHAVMQRGNRKTPADGHWKQKNYYFTTNVHQLLKATIHGYDTNGYNGPHRDSHMANSFSYMPDGEILNLCFIWEFSNQQSSKTAGLHYEGDVEMNGNKYKYKADAWASITVDQQPNTLCLTHMRYNAGVKTWGGKWHDDCWFEVYDVFGNMGTLSAKWDKDAIVIRDGKP